MTELFHSNMFVGIIALAALGIAPSAVWLSYYLKQDNNPEPKLAILRVFCYGFISTFVAFGIEWVLIHFMEQLSPSCSSCASAVSQLFNPSTTYTLIILSVVFLAVLALIEEWVKYAASRIEIIRSPYFDEPVDAMIYLIIAALGFAAAENIGYILQNPDNAIGIAYLRFLSSTSLHALSSAIIGYFLTLSIIHRRSKLAYIAVGIGCATLLHALFNFLIITSEWQRYPTLSIITLMLGAFFIVSLLFKSAKQLSFTKAQF